MGRTQVSMGFYDSVKDRVRSQENTGEGDDAAKEDEAMPFDHLKKQAGEQDDPEEDGQPRSDTDIEVLASGERVDTPEPSPSAGGEDAQQAASGTAEETATRTVQEQQEPETRPAADGAGELVGVLRNIEEQNAEILTVLRGIKRSLDGADGP